MRTWLSSGFSLHTRYSVISKISLCKGMLPLVKYTDAQLVSVLSNGRRNKTIRKEIVKLTKYYFQQKFLELVLEPLHQVQRRGGFAGIINGVIPSPDWCDGNIIFGNVTVQQSNVAVRLGNVPSAEIDISQARILYPAVACWALDNQGSAAHLCLAISNRSRHKCRKCLINRTEITVPGLIGQQRNFFADITLALSAQKALTKKWKGTERLSEKERFYLQRCAFLNIQKMPVTYNIKECFSTFQDPYRSCPYDDLHTLSEGLMKAWVIWTVICIASVSYIDTNGFELSMHTLDSLLMGFPSVMIPEVLRRHRFPHVRNVSMFLR